MTTTATTTKGVGSNNQSKSSSFWKRPAVTTAVGRVRQSNQKRAMKKGKLSTFEEFNASISDAWSMHDDEDEIEPQVVNSQKEPATKPAHGGKGVVGDSHTQTTPQPASHKSSDQSGVLQEPKPKPNKPAPEPLQTSQEQISAMQATTEEVADNMTSSAPSTPMKKRVSSSSLTDFQVKTPSRNARQDLTLASTSGSASLITRSTQPGDTKSRGEMRIGKFEKGLKSGDVNLDSLKALSWSGVPSQVRAMVWRLLCGYLPANESRRQATLERKRDEYKSLIAQYFGTRTDPENAKTFHQIQIDIPRTCPAVPTFQQKIVQEMLERVLYLWAIRHPGSGYVQGINDLATPFLVVFLDECIDCDVVECDTSTIPQVLLDDVEADCFWCLSRLLDGIHDNYTPGQPGIQAKVSAVEDITRRVNGALVAHLESHGVMFLQFCFRWINCLLMREMPMRCTIRLWDTCLSEPDGFASFHVYVCAAFLGMFSDHLLSLNDFQEILCTLQNLPTATWTYEEVEVVLAQAFMYKTMFHNAQSHLS